MCEQCSGGSDVDTQIAYLERVIRDQEKLASVSPDPRAHEDAVRMARAALDGLRRSRDMESCVHS